MNIIKDYTFAFNKQLVSFVRNFIIKVKEESQLTDKDLQEILGLESNSYKLLLDKNFDGNISSGIIATLYILTNGKISLQEIWKDNVVGMKSIEEYLRNIQERHYHEKVTNLLEKLGIHNENDLDNFLSLFDENNLITE
jgi:hypothetical protein